MMKRKYIVLAIVLVVFVVVLAFFWSYWRNGTLELSAPSNLPESSEVTIDIIQEGSSKSLTLKAGQTKKMRVSPGTVQVTAAADQLKSISVVRIEPRKTTTLTTPSGQQHAVERLAINPRFCPITLAEKIYSYNCQQAPGVVVRHNPTSSTTVFGGQLFSGLEPLQTGLLGFFATDSSALQYLNLQTETVQSVPLPPFVQQLMQNETPLLATSDEPGDPRFLLVFLAANKIYLFDGLTDDNPIDIQLPNDVSTNQAERIVSANLVTDGVVIYAGADLQSEDGGSEEQAIQPANLPSFVFEYNNAGELTKTISLGNDFTADRVYKLTDQYYLAERDNVYEFCFYDQNNFRSIYSLNEVSDWVTFQNKTYIQAGGTLYLFTPTTGGLFSLESVFSWPNMTVSAVFSSDEGLLFTAFLEKSTSAPLTVYRLLDTLAEPGQTPPGAVAPSELEFIGLDQLLDLGVSSAQLQGVKQAFTNFVGADAADQVAVIDPTAVPHSRFSSDTVDTVTFDAVVGDDTYSAKLEYTNLTTIRLYLSDANGAVVFDSQPITN